ncbi:hypothetical protein [Paraburkholderia sp.]|uniref:hypothetical protein n=1 Tax=Paraburkholderia sp. TaxID=1926495 RepID=UPI00239BEBB4|nr:hypothetical protein [Paraburkholderia sp.]MDE1182347.1 hypothetical protein [Paraburkholderia sp.]
MAKNRTPSVVRNQDIGRYASLYAAEVARGASHIASTLTPKTLAAAVSETMAEFVGRHGHHPFEIFRQLLVEALEKRDRADAAALVTSHGKTGAAGTAGQRAA